MTNAEKYLKDGVDKNELLNDFGEMYADNELQKSVLMLGIKNFFEAKVKEDKIQLTEGERVILRNINKRFNRIKRNEFGFLILTENGCEKIGEAMHTLYAFNNLFQFIKERRRI